MSKGNVTSQHKILIVEDNKVERILLKGILGNSMFNLEFCKDGREAWNWINANSPPDLILLDLHLPFISGFELLKLIGDKSSWKKVKIIVCSAHNDRESILTAIKSGADKYISKPFDIERLQNEVQKVLKLSKTKV